MSKVFLGNSLHPLRPLHFQARPLLPPSHRLRMISTLIHQPQCIAKIASQQPRQLSLELTVLHEILRDAEILD